jgi:branched-chain amino acid transport system substrate-binding protein
MSDHGRTLLGVFARWIVCLLVLAVCACSKIRKSIPENETINPGTAEIRIAYFGPGDPAHPIAGGLWQGACMANRAGGFNGCSLRLVPCWADNPWSAGVSQVAKLAFAGDTCAVIGGIDGPTTHLAEQVVVKAQLALISPASTDKTVNLAFVPWAFSCLPDDQAQSPILADAIVGSLGAAGSFVVLSADDHDSQLFTVELFKALGDRSRNPRHHMQLDRNERDPSPFIQTILEFPSDSVVLLAAPQTAARFLHALRNKGFSGPVFGGPWMGQSLFRESAGPAAEGVIFPLLWTPSPAADRFTEDFRARTGKAPDYLAAQMYDAVTLLAEAIRKAGPDRVALIESLKTLSPWQGVTGIIQWDRLGRNQRPVLLGTIRNGRIQPLSK